MINEPDSVQEQHAKTIINTDEIASYVAETCKNGPFYEDVADNEVLKQKLIWVEKKAPMPAHLKRNLK